MGSEISSFVLEPLVGGGAVALAIFAIIKENKDEPKNARWFAIASIILTLILILLNIILTVVTA